MSWESEQSFSERLPNRSSLVTEDHQKPTDSSDFEYVSSPSFQVCMKTDLPGICRHDDSQRAHELSAFLSEFQMTLSSIKLFDSMSSCDDNCEFDVLLELYHPGRFVSWSAAGVQPGQYRYDRRASCFELQNEELNFTGDVKSTYYMVHVPVFAQWLSIAWVELLRSYGDAKCGFRLGESRSVGAQASIDASFCSPKNTTTQKSGRNSEKVTALKYEMEYIFTSPNITGKSDMSATSTVRYSADFLMYCMSSLAHSIHNYLEGKDALKGSDPLKSSAVAGRLLSIIQSVEGTNESGFVNKVLTVNEIRHRVREFRRRQQSERSKEKERESDTNEFRERCASQDEFANEQHSEKGDAQTTRVRGCRLKRKLSLSSSSKQLYHTVIMGLLDQDQMIPQALKILHGSVSKKIF